MQRRLGRTGLSVSPIGLGLAALGRPGYINLGHAADMPRGRTVEDMERRCHEVLDAAWAAGICYVDAARSYGRAEEFLATWLRSHNLGPGALTVGSKWGYRYTGDWRVDAERHEVKEHSIEALRRQVAESRSVLGEHLALYQIHSATPESGVLDNASVLAELARLREEGLRLGVSVSGPSQSQTVLRAVELLIDGAPLFDTIQATWNLLDRSAEPALHDAADAGLGIIVKEVLANGRLTERNREPGFGARAVLQRVAERHHSSLVAVAIGAALRRPWASVVLSGAATVAQLRSNMAATRLALDDEDDAELDALAEDVTAYWETRSALPWN